MVQTLKRCFLIEVEMHMEEPEEHTPHPSLSLAADRRLICVGGLELLTGEGRISPSHLHQKCIMNILQACPPRAVGAGFDVSRVAEEVWLRVKFLSILE